jgi:exodeoxyribonuclease VII small subunit
MAADEHRSGDTAERPPTDFAETVERLETLVQQLESGELSLEGSLEAFEQGVRLTREAQRRLDEAELRVRTLTEGKNGGPLLAPFDPSQEAQEPGEGGNGER